MYKIYFFCCKLLKKSNKKDNYRIKFLKLIIGQIEAYYNLYIKKIWLKSKPPKLNGKKREERIIVSLTSYPKRIDIIWLTIMSIFKQSMKPDEIILWLAENQFDSIDSLPKELIKLQKFGLRIKLCDDLKSHKKYFYALQEYKNDLVILIDDDMFYPRDTIQKLYKMHKKYPNDICTMSAQKMNSLLPSKWTNINVDEKYEHSTEIQVFTGSGSLYPGNCLYKDAFDKELIKKLSPYADDLWITYMALKKGTKITCYHPWRSFPITIYGTAEGSLWYINGLNNKNDQQWKNIIEYYEGRD